MSQTKIIAFRIKDGVITRVTELQLRDHVQTTLTDPRDIEVAVARVANTPVGGKISEEKP